MTRATGVLVGALLMLAVFLLVLSSGDITPSVQVAVSSEAELPAGPTGTTGPAPVVDVAAKNAVDTASPDEESRLDIKDSGMELDPESWNQSMASAETPSRNDVTEVSRYRVWSPFHSQWAAQGFARRLTLATEVPVEVVNEGPGSYQVVFSYRDDGERQAMVKRIETVTGLELE